MLKKRIATRLRALAARLDPLPTWAPLYVSPSESYTSNSVGTAKITHRTGGA